MKLSNVSYEVLLVDDGSSDNAFEEMKMLEGWEELRLIRSTQNLGSGASIKSALLQALGESYAQMPEELASLLAHVSDFDVIVTHFQTEQAS